MEAVDDPAFLRYVLRLADAGVALSDAEARELDLFAQVPHADDDEEIGGAGEGWRVVPAEGYEDWPVLEATPQRIRTALQTARRALWRGAGGAGIRAADVVAADHQIDLVLGVVRQAEAGGYPVSVSYVS